MSPACVSPLTPTAAGCPRCPTSGQPPAHCLPPPVAPGPGGTAARPAARAAAQSIFVDSLPQPYHLLLLSLGAYQAPVKIAIIIPQITFLMSIIQNIASPHMLEAYETPYFVPSMFA